MLYIVKLQRSDTQHDVREEAAIQHANVANFQGDGREGRRCRSTVARVTDREAAGGLLSREGLSRGSAQEGATAMNAPVLIFSVDDGGILSRFQWRIGSVEPPPLGNLTTNGCG